MGHELGVRGRPLPGGRPGTATVRWERLTPAAGDRDDFLEVSCEPGGHSAGSRQLLRHDGYEYSLITSGTLRATVGFESCELESGDSVAFGSATPHECWSTSGAEVRAVWAVVHAVPGRADGASRPDQEFQHRISAASGPAARLSSQFAPETRQEAR